MVGDARWEARMAYGVAALRITAKRYKMQNQNGYVRGVLRSANTLTPASLDRRTQPFVFKLQESKRLLAMTQSLAAALGETVEH